MLVDFQIALAELTASPALCRQFRNAPETLRARYALTEREWRRLVGVVSSKGMEANCMLYRANRLTPVALNLPDTCNALGEKLTPLISDYWDSEPNTNVHFLVEADRFCRFLSARADLPASVKPLLEREHAVITSKLAVSRSSAQSDAGF